LYVSLKLLVVTFSANCAALIQVLVANNVVGI
jgi:hypothetical protein